MLLQYSVFNKGQEVQTELPLMVRFLENPQNGMLKWVHNSQSDSNNDLWRLWMSQWLLRLQGISICSASIQGAGLTGRAERYVPEPGDRRQVRADAEGKVVDFSTLQCVAGVVLVSLVPGQDAPFMLWPCWTHVNCVKPYCYRHPGTHLALDSLPLLQHQQYSIQYVKIEQFQNCFGTKVHHPVEIQSQVLWLSCYWCHQA